MKKVIENEFILKALKKKDKLTEKMNEVEKINAKIIKENEANQKDFQDTLAKLKREDEKVRPELKREAESIELGEFETIGRVYLGKEGDDKGKVIIETTDNLEAFKINFKKQQDESKKDNSSDTDKGDGDSNTNTTIPAETGDPSGD
jgi:hypothetical protein